MTPAGSSKIEQDNWTAWFVEQREQKKKKHHGFYIMTWFSYHPFSMSATGWYERETGNPGIYGVLWMSN